MKKIITTLTLLAVLFTACKEDSDPSAREKTINKLTASAWIADQVTHSTDGDLTFQYEDFSMLLSKSNANNYDGEFYIANGGNAFPEAMGKWRVNDDQTTIILDNGREIDFEFTENTLTLDFVVEPTESGRANGLSGHFTFTLSHPM